MVALAILLYAGESEARLLAIHPHRQWRGGAPKLTATLEGPRWTAEFNRRLHLTACGQLGGSWHVPAKCLGATLPETIQPGVTYILYGTAPLGSFTGDMRMPTVPALVEPEHTLRLPLPDEAGLVGVPIEYQAGLDIGTLLADVLEVFEKPDSGPGEEVPTSELGPFPTTVEGAQRDTVWVYQDGIPVRFSMHLLGIGWNYTNFLKHTGIDPLPRPWPSFGIEGEGVYGYFDGVSTSGPVRIFVGDAGGHDRTR